MKRTILSLLLASNLALVSTGFVSAQTTTTAETTTAQTGPTLFEDKVTKEKIGTKTILTETLLPNTDEENGVSVTMNGFQWTDYTPAEADTETYKDYAGGVVLLTVDLSITNNTEKTIRLEGTTANLELENDKVWVANVTDLEDTNETLVKKGESAQRYVVFAVSKEDYEKNILQDVELDLVLVDETGATINCGDTFSFDIVDV